MDTPGAEAPQGEAIADSPDNSENDDDLTCCRRATCCYPSLRDVLVTEPVNERFCGPFTYANLFWLITVLAMLLMSYASLYFYIGDPLLPGGSIFGLFAVVVFAYFLGWTLAYLPYLNLPPVFGMLLAGIVVRNLDWYDIRESLGTGVSSKIRTFSVTFVMLRAGLQLTSSALREHPLFVLNLAVVPCTVEMLTVALCCRCLLDYPWAWAFLTGSIIACISPVVPVNCILALAERGYGEDKDMATLLFTAASIDDIHIVSVYAICFAFIFTHDDQPVRWWSYVPGSLRDLLMGVTCGAALGLFFVFFPHRRHKYALWYRVCGLVLGSLMCTSGASKIAITGGGFLATIIMSLIATTGWRVLSVPFDVKPLRKAVHIMWHFMQPLLVGVIGADIDFRNWSLARFGLYILCIALGLLMRTAFAYLATLHAPFNVRERVFVALSWLSKGTLQAALAPMTFEQARQNDDPTELALAIDVVRMSVVSIVFLAPLGAIIMMLTGPLLLGRTSDEEHRRRRELSYLRILSLQPLRKRRSTAIREL